MEKVGAACSQVLSEYLSGGQCQSLSKPAPPAYEAGMLTSIPQCLVKTGTTEQLCSKDP
jgi:hypothetical protein